MRGVGVAADDAVGVEAAGDGGQQALGVAASMVPAGSRA